MDAPTQDLVRAQMEAPAVRDDGNTLHGYAAVFNEWTEINSWEGRFMERVLPGAFKRTLQHRGAPKVLFNHGMDPSIGDKPLGKATAHEDARGLYLEVPLSDTSYNQDLRALIADGALDGMSFRFSVPKGGDRWNDSPKRSADNPDGLPERDLVEVNAPEAGPVTWPAYTATTLGIRSVEAFNLYRSMPPHLRDAVLRGEVPDLSELADGTSDSNPNPKPEDPPEVALVGLSPHQREAALRGLNL